MGLLFKTPKENYYRGMQAIREKDYEKGERWLRDAARHGYAEAAYACGWQALNCHNDPDTALAYFTQAAGQGHSKAQTECGDICREKGQREKALEWYKKAAEQGYDAAQIACAELLLRYSKREKDHAEARAWLEKAAAPLSERVNSHQYTQNLAMCAGPLYDYGDHKADRLRALVWAEKAAEKKN